MEMCYDGALVMPSNYAVMDEEEMTYVEGGGNISYSIFMRSRAYCTAYASGYRSGAGYNKISTYDLAAEIFAHAYAYYDWSGFVALAAAAGFSMAKSFYNSIKNGIDVKDGLDTATIYGVKRYIIFRAIFSAAPGIC